MNQENGQGPSGQEFVFADQDGRKTGLELAQLELVFKEAVALAKDPNRVDQAQSNFSKAHVALSVDDPKTNDFGYLLRRLRSVINTAADKTAPSLGLAAQQNRARAQASPAAQPAGFVFIFYFIFTMTFAWPLTSA
ncbi:MAG: hypothetical protein WCO91_08895 [Gemmataceae bacterium]